MLIARVVEWHTRTTQNRVPQGLWVQVPPRAQAKLGVGVERRSYVAIRKLRPRAGVAKMLSGSETLFVTKSHLGHKN